MAVYPVVRLDSAPAKASQNAESTNGLRIFRQGIVEVPRLVPASRARANKGLRAGGGGITAHHSNHTKITVQTPPPAALPSNIDVGDILIDLFQA